MSEGVREIGQLAALEAALYAAGRPVDIDNLKKILRTKSTKIVLKLVGKLREQYEQRQSAFEVKELPGNRVILQLRANFSKVVRRMTNRPLLTSGPLKTLSYIAYYQPVPQVKIVSERGVRTYVHLKMMEEMGLITREKSNEKEVVVKTTPYFSDYFGFSEDPQKTRLQLHRIFSRMKITKLDNGNGHVDVDNVAKEPSLGAESLVLADPGDGLPDGLTDYPGAANEGSE